MVTDALTSHVFSCQIVAEKHFLLPDASPAGFSTQLLRQIFYQWRARLFHFLLVRGEGSRLACDIPGPSMRISEVLFPGVLLHPDFLNAALFGGA